MSANTPFHLHGFSPSLRTAERLDAVSALPVRNVKEMPWVHVAKGLVPPTNRWYSGLVFDSPHPIYPMPLSYMQTAQGFVLGLPRVTASRHTISGPALPDIDINVGASSFRVSSSDLASVTIDMLNAVGRVLGKVVIAQGVPYVSYTAEVAHDIVMSEPFSWQFENCAVARVEGREYGLVTTGAFASQAIRLTPGQYVTFIGFPQDLPDGKTREDMITRLAKHAAYPVQRTEVSASVDGDLVHTTIRYIARENGPVAVIRMAHHGACNDEQLGGYHTVAGTVTLTSAKVFSWSTPRVEARGHLDVRNLPQHVRDELVVAVTQELSTVPRAPRDTYFAGKALYRQAHLLMLAEQLDIIGAPEFRTRVENNLLRWMHPDGAQRYDDKFFVYDDQWRGVVGVEASFGADEFNDHHFHYGYFLYAAALLTRSNPALRTELTPVLDALVADIAHHSTSQLLPTLRVFDTYKGHSWASGTAPFDEGNNQESSSEAVNAWNGLALWAAVSGDDELAALATWLLSLEAHSANTYWTNFERGDQVRSGYQHNIVPLVWGAKHDYATWFSGEPSALLAILVLPMSPVSHYLAKEPGRILDNLEEVVGFYEDYDVSYGDFLLMYLALAGPDHAQRAWDKARELSDDRIDDGNSRAYMLAWIATHCDWS
ncbi:glycosyl hydrolase [Jonesia quinghaiensis]|uniref:glycosyl hydrolase n=1 Tax=Jonesia quinghaiensis TaxID=262806 RepID=UPI000A040E6B|nr:glycosyl hydrolase [Jonesia quinghaiensis]